MPRFVVLTHEMPACATRKTHWDFMLEEQQVLLTWALSQPPEGGVAISCRQLAPHRLAYLEYTGPVSGQRGVVSQWDSGLFAWCTHEPHWVQIELQGSRLSGRVSLHPAAYLDSPRTTRNGGREQDGLPDDWLFRYEESPASR